MQIGGGVWQRNFSSAKGTTVATYDQNTKKGTVWWAGEPAPAPTPAPPPPPAPTPPPAYCTAPMHDTGLANADLGNAQAVASFGECCERCHGRKGCVAWAWHAEQGGACHLHTAQASLHPKPTGCVSGYINATLQARA